MKRLYQRGIKWLQEHRIPLGLFLVTILIFFGRTIFLQQFYFFGDLKVMFYPLESEYSTFQNQWSLPQWSSHFGFGQPLMAWAQIGFFTPVHLILRVFQLHALVLIHLSMAIHFLIGLIGMYCFMRKRDVSTLGAFLAAIVFVFNGYTIYHLVHVNFFVATMWIPWLLLAIDAWFQKPKGYWLSMMSLLSAFMLLSGHLQLVLYCLIVVLLWAIVLLIAHWRLEMRWLLRVSLSALLVLALTAGLSSLALFPIYEFLPDNDRRGGYTEEEFYVFSFPPHHAITLVLPSFFGSQGNYKGAKSEQELGSYVGIIPLLLAGLACIRYKYIFSQRTQQRILLIYAVILFVVSVAFALGQYSPVYRWLVDAQLFPAFTAPGRFLIFFATAIAILAGIGCDVVPTLARRAYRSHLFWQLGPILLASVITIVPLGSKMGTDSAFLQAVKNLPALPPLELASALLGLCLWGALWMIRHTPRSVTLMKTVLVITATGSLLYYGPYRHPLVSSAEALTQSPFTEDLRTYRDEYGSPARLYSQPTIFTTSADPDLLPTTKVTKSLSPSFAVHQEIVATQDTFSCLTVALRSNRARDDYLTLTIREVGQSVPLRELTLSTQRDLVSAGNHLFCFEPITDSAGKWYLISFTKSAAATGQLASSVVLLYQLTNETTSRLFFTANTNIPDGTQQPQAGVALVMEPGYEPSLQMDREVARLSHHMNATAPVSGALWVGSLAMDSYYTFARHFFANDRQPYSGDGVHVLEENRILFDMSSITHALHALPQAAEDRMNEHQFSLVQEEVVNGSRMRLYRNEQSLPRVFLAQQALPDEDPTATYRALGEATYDPTATIYVQGPSTALPDSRNGAQPTLEDRAVITDYTPARVAITASTPTPAWLVLTDTAAAQWQSWVDGQLVPDYVANTLFRTVPLSAGTHEVVFEYHSPAIATAIPVTVVSGVVLVLLGVWPLLWRQWWKLYDHLHI